MHAPFARDTRTRFGTRLGIGLLFGAALWLVNLQILARLLMPWFLNTPQLFQLLMHALFYGAPLGLSYANAERRVRYTPGVPRSV